MTNCFSRLEIDDQLEIRRLLHWNVVGLLAAEYLATNWAT